VDKSTLERKQRQLIVHSFIYYELNDNIWTDSQYDVCALSIEEQKNTKLWKQSKFYSIFKDWDSSTGMSLIKGRSKEYVQYYTHFTNLAKELLHFTSSNNLDQ
jgi:hypothetical protein